MTLMIELPPETEQRLRAAAARQGQTAEGFARAAVESVLAAVAPPTQEEQRERNAAAIALLDQWAKEDAADPDPDPVPEIPRLSLREVRIE